MANQIRLKRASGSDPSASDLVTGELAVRTDTAKLFTKKDDNSVAQIGGGLSNVVEDTSPQLGGDLQSNGHNIALGDSGSTSDDRITLGAGSDMQLYHNGTESVITNGTGDLYINNNADTIIKPANDCFIKPQGGENGISVIGNGAVELYHNNSKKLETSNAGVEITGKLFVDGIDMEDDEKILLGTSDDLEIFHNGSGSYLRDVGTGNLELWSNTLVFRNAAGNEVMAGFLEDGTAKLYYNNVQTFETTSSGCTLTGNLAVTGTVDGRDVASDGTKLDGIESNATADQSASEIVALIADQSIAPSTIDMEDNEKIKLGTGDDLEIYHNGSVNRIWSVTSKNIDIGTSNDFFVSRIDTDGSNSENMIVGRRDGEVELYHNGSEKLETKSGGINVTGQVECDEIYLKDNEKILLGASSDLQIYHDGSNSYVSDLGTGNLKITTSGAGIDIDKGSSEHMARFKIDAEVELYFNNTLCFETSAYGVKVHGGANGNFVDHNGGTVTFDFSSAAYHFVNMNANSTFAAPINSQIGHSGSIFLTQDGTGGRTGSFNSAFKFVGGTAPTLSTAANAVDRLDFIVLDDSPLTVHIAVSLDVK